MITPKFNKNAVIFILLLLFLFLAFIYIANQNKKQDNLYDKPAVGFQNGCVTKIEDRLVRGNSLSGLIEDGASVKILFGFYDCDKIKREDVIVYNYAGNSEPLIKIVKGVSGDKFQLQKTENGWHILINGEIIKNSENQPYILDERTNGMLSLYEKDYKGIIPKDAYLILGNLSNGSLDSSRFGLIDKSDILGKVVF